MKFIDEDGKIAEGTPLSPEEEIIWAEIIDIIKVSSFDYVSMRSATRITRKLLQEYKITKRIGVPVSEQSGDLTSEVFTDALAPTEYEDSSVPDSTEEKEL